jgi:hypothetical protein
MWLSTPRLVEETSQAERNLQKAVLISSSVYEERSILAESDSLKRG